MIPKSVLLSKQCLSDKDFYIRVTVYLYKSIHIPYNRLQEHIDVTRVFVKALWIKCWPGAVQTRGFFRQCKTMFKPSTRTPNTSLENSME